MTADIVTFPSRPAGEPVTVRHRSTAGDIVVTCINATVGLWCAWPVAVVDDDGVVLGVHTRSGRMLGVDRLSCAEQVLGLRAADHQAEGFAALRWRTWGSMEAAAASFAEVTACR